MHRFTYLLIFLCLPSIAVAGGVPNGDFDCDGDLDEIDFAVFQSCFSGAGGGLDDDCVPGDFDGDGDVDLVDFGSLQLAFSGPAPGGLPSVKIGPTPLITMDLSVALDGNTTGAATVQIVGGAAIVVADVASCAFATTVTLQPNMINSLFVTPIDGNGVTGPPTPVTITHDMQPPTLFIDFPADGSDVTNETTTVAGRVGDALSGFMGLAVFVNGLDATVDIGIGPNGTFERQGVALAVGPNEITATAMDLLGNTTVRSITVTRVEIPAGSPSMSIESGNGQVATIQSVLAEPTVVKVLRGDGTPFVNKVVTFDVTHSDGRLTAARPTPGDGGSMMLQVHTDVDGVARAWWQLGTDAGCGNNRVEVTSTSILGTVDFCASATPGPVAQINVSSGNNQRVEVNGPANEPLRVWVSDGCNGVSGVPVTFTVLQGGGLVGGSTSSMINTSDTGHAALPYQLGPQSGNQIVEATFPGNPSAPVTFVVVGVVRDETQPTRLSGLLFDNASQPIGGADCELILSDGTTLKTTTSIEGVFAFGDIPTGGLADLFVYGNTATHLGGGRKGRPIPTGSFPHLHFQPVLVPNADNSLPSPVLLPPLDPVNNVDYVVQPDGSSQDVELTVVGIEGLTMTVRAGTTITLADGTDVGPNSPGSVTLSLNQVHNDNVPMPMPDGAAPPFAWTLQPAGARFDPSIEITYPNMSHLPPGAIAYFLSFNHNTNRFEIVATGQVTEDGSCIESDPGSGLTVAGWGCNCPPYSVTGECDKCEVEIEGESAVAIAGEITLTASFGDETGKYSWERIEGTAADISDGAKEPTVTIQGGVNPSTALDDVVFQVTFVREDGFKCTSRHELTVVGFRVLVPPLPPNFDYCDGQSVTVQIVPVPDGSPTSALEQFSDFELQSGILTEPSNPPNPAGTVELVFSSVALPAFTSIIERALWFSTSSDHCNVLSSYLILASAMSGTTKVSSIITGESTLVVSTKANIIGPPAAFGFQCLGGTAAPLPGSFWSGELAVTVAGSPGAYTATLSLGTLTRDILASISLEPTHPNSQFIDWIVAEETFHKGQYEGTTSDIFDHLWDPLDVLADAISQGPFTAPTIEEVVAEARNAEDLAKGFVEGRDLDIATGFGPGSLRCQAECEAKAAVGACFRISFPCAYGDCEGPFEDSCFTCP
jgi:Glucodextranase, domain B